MPEHDNAGAAWSDRDRDPAQRPRNARPRDGLGRPLPYGSPGVQRQPEGVRRTPAEALAEAARLFDVDRPFHAHEVFEDAWKAAPGDERGLWRGLAQLAVGSTHAARGNRSGAVALLRRGAQSVAPYAARRPHGVDVPAVLRWAESAAERAEAGRPLPRWPLGEPRDGRGIGA